MTFRALCFDLIIIVENNTANKTAQISLTALPEFSTLQTTKTVQGINVAVQQGKFFVLEDFSIKAFTGSQTSLQGFMRRSLDILKTLTQ